MNLADGKLLNADEKQDVLNSLDEKILKTLAKGKLDLAVVINACDQLSRSIQEQKHLRTLLELGFDQKIALSYITQVRQMLSKECLRRKLETELGQFYTESRRFIPLHCTDEIQEKILPLGVLLHIAAGNADGLPVFTVLEGLLSGNINLVKLPEGGDSISSMILMELLSIEPALAEYIYIFDYSSKEVEAIKKLVEIADAIVVWGSDIAVNAVRKLAKPDTKIIEWGHKISFAYVTERGINIDQLTGLAQNICETNQLLCSSCQGIFIDTDSMEKVYQFCELFIKILSKVSRNYPTISDIGLEAQISLQLYNKSLEAIGTENRIYRNEACSLIASSDSILEPSIMFRNSWVKPLPHEKLLETLRPYKNHPQTVGLLCSPNEKSFLFELFVKTGIVRITSGKNMSSVYCGAPHDGEYSLRRYTKIVSME